MLRAGPVLERLALALCVRLRMPLSDATNLPLSRLLRYAKDSHEH